MIRVSEQEKWAVKFCSITIAEGRTGRAAEMRNPPSFPETILNRSQAVRWVVGEAVQQWWADDDQ
jgi:hypothetical protein